MDVFQHQGPGALRALYATAMQSIAKAVPTPEQIAIAKDMLVCAATLMRVRLPVSIHAGAYSFLLASRRIRLSLRTRLLNIIVYLCHGVGVSMRVTESFPKVPNEMLC